MQKAIADEDAAAATQAASRLRGRRHGLPGGASVIRRLLTLVVLTAALAGAGVATGISAASADSPSVSRKDTIAKVQEVRGSIDRTLALIKAGQSEQAFEEAKAGYLNHFEFVEIPLRVADNSLTIHAESLFAEIRTMIRNDDPESEIRDKIVELRGVIDDVERKLTDRPASPLPLLVLGQSFLIIFREGLRGRPAAVRAARLPRGREVDAVHAADRRRRRRRRDRDRAHRASSSARSSPRCRSGRRCSRRSPRSWPWRCSSTCPSGSSPASSTSAGSSS